MANKLPWFTHDHNARNDEFIQASIDKFGHFGYSAYFMILELLHEHGTGDKLIMPKSRLALNLRSRWPQVHLYLDFSRTSGKVDFTLIGDQVHLQIKKFRERQSKLKSNLPPTFRQPSVNLPIEREGEVEREREREVIRTSPIFQPPKIEDVSAYCLERGKGVDPQRWHDFYSAKGWLIGKNKMKDWKAAIRTWEGNENGNYQNGSSKRIVGAAAPTRGKFDAIDSGR